MEMYILHIRLQVRHILHIITQVKFKERIND